MDSYDNNSTNEQDNNTSDAPNNNIDNIYAKDESDAHTKKSDAEAEQIPNCRNSFGNNDSNTGIGASASYTFGESTTFDLSDTSAQKKEKKKKKGAAKITALILSCILFAGGAGFGGAYLAYRMLGGMSDLGIGTPPPSDANGGENKYEHNGPIEINKVEGSSIPASTMTEVIEKVRDSVVEIVTENITESKYYGKYVTSGAGSGVIINKNGYIITNHHVVNGANTISVRTTNEKEYKATIVGSDEESDIAIIKIEATDLAAATLGDSSALKLGEQVIAIGNPLGRLGGTVTDGIISALDRQMTIDGQNMVLLQTNAAVNPGNSGGGLFNMAGHLIGIVNAKSSSSSSETTIEGLGFAIPINHAFEIATQLIEHGYVRGKVTLDFSTYYYSQTKVIFQGTTRYYIKAGVYVDDPGKNTELSKNDRFISIDGTIIYSPTDIDAVISNHKIGDKIKATVARVEKGRETQIEVTLTCYEYIPKS